MFKIVPGAREIDISVISSAFVLLFYELQICKHKKIKSRGTVRDFSDNYLDFKIKLKIQTEYSLTSLSMSRDILLK